MGAFQRFVAGEATLQELRTEGHHFENNNSSEHTPCASPAGGPCNTCARPSTVRCMGCKTTYYCDRKCQKRDWKEHKKSCGAGSKSSGAYCGRTGSGGCRCDGCGSPLLM